MAIQYKVLTFTKQAGTGTQAITGAGFQPTWVMLLWTGNTTFGTITDDCALGFGHSDGALQASRYITALDGSTNPDAGYSINFSSIFRKVTNVSNAVGTPTVTDEASLASLDADGFTLNWTANSGSADVVVAVCGSGPATIVQPSITTGSSGSVTGAGFQPNALILIGGNDTGSGVGANEFAAYIGICDQNLNQFWSEMIRSNNGDCEAVNYNGTTSIFGGINIVGGVTGGSPSGRLIISSLDADGFSYTGTGSTSPATLKHSFLCLGAQSFAESRTSDGTTAALGFTPGLSLHHGLNNSGNAGSMGIGVSDGSSMGAATATLFVTTTNRAAKVISNAHAALTLNAPNATASLTTFDAAATNDFGGGGDTVTWDFTANGFGWALYLEGIEVVQPTDTGEGGSSSEVCCKTEKKAKNTPGAEVTSNPAAIGPLPPWTAMCEGGGAVDSVMDLSPGETW